jgi:8-oxo-dGTP diphosphatase
MGGFDPHQKPVPAVAAIILRDREILLIRRGGEPGAGLWSIPGGSVELGETLEESLKREVREETGLEIMVGKLAGVHNLVVREAGRIRFHYVILDYSADVISGEICAASDVTDCRWVRLDDLGQYELTESLIARLKEFQIIK